MTLLMPTRSRKRQRVQQPALPAGVLLPLVALGADGTMILDDGSFVRILACYPRNFDIFTPDDELRSYVNFRDLGAALSRGQSLQFLVENQRISTNAHLAFMESELEKTFGFNPRAITNRDVSRLDEEHRWRWGIYKMIQGSVLRGSPVAEFTPLRRCYAVCRYQPDADYDADNVRSVIPGWVPFSQRRVDRSTTSAAASLLRSGPGGDRTVEEHARMADDADLAVQTVRSQLRREGTVTSPLDGDGVLRYLRSRLSPTPRLDGFPAEVAFAQFEDSEPNTVLFANFGGAIEYDDAVAAAVKLRESIAASPLHFREDPFHGRIDEDLTRTLYLTGAPSSTHTFWIAALLGLPLPFTLSVHLHGLDRGAVQDLAVRQEHQAMREIERTRQKGKRDSGAEEAHRARANLVTSMQRDPRETMIDMSLQLCIRAPGPAPDAHKLDRAMAQAKQIVKTSTAGGVLADGHGRQEPLWLSTLPFCYDQSDETVRVGVANAADTIPLVGSDFGSPTGLPVVISRTTREVQSINPFDRQHPNATTVVTGTSGTGKTAFVNHLVGGSVTLGAHAVVFDRQGDFEFLAELIPGSRVVRLGGDEGDAINPWDVPDPARPSAEKIKFLMDLHRVLLNRPLHMAEKKLLGDAIRSTYQRCARRGTPPRESEMLDVMVTSARVLKENREQAARQGAAQLRSDDVAAERLDTLIAELSEYVGDGVYASVWDRLTTLQGDPPLIIFDYSGASKELLPSLVYTTMEWTRLYTQRIAHEARAVRGKGLFHGRSVVVLDEGHSWTHVAEAADEVQRWAREARHWGAWFIVLSQDAEDFAGDAKAVLSNASLLFFFKQDESMLEFLRQNVKLPGRLIDIMETLGTEKGHYSECVVINGGRGIGVGKVILGPHAYWAYTSEPINDVPRRLRALEESNGNAWGALDILAKEGIPDAEAGPAR